MALPLRVDLAPARLEAAAGDRVEVDVRMRNVSDIVEHYAVELVGPPERLRVEVQPPVTKLMPREAGNATLQLVLPPDHPPEAGTYVLGVLVRSQHRPEVSRCEELELSVAPVHGLVVRAAPDVVHGRAEAQFALTLQNTGNTHVNLRLAGADPERAVTAAFAPAAGGVRPGEEVRAVLTVRAPRPWSQEKQRQIKVEALTSEGTAGSTVVTFVQRPRLASRLARIAGAAAAVTGLSGAIVAAAVIARPAAHADTPSNTGPAAVTTSAAPSPSASAPPSASATPSPSATPTPTASPSITPTASPSPSAGTPSPSSGPALVDLTKPPAVAPDGSVASDAFRDQNLILSGLPELGGTDPCRDANTVYLRGADASHRFLVPGRPGDPAACNQVPLQIRFIRTVTSAEVVVATPTSAQRLVVTYSDGSTDTTSDLRVTAPAGKQIAFVVFRPTDTVDPASSAGAGVTAVRTS